MFDPVCLKEIDKNDSTIMLEHEGKNYYFCSLLCKEKFIKNPECYIKKNPSMNMTIGVMGSASKEESEKNRKTAFELGRCLAEKKYVLITGACPGLPYECAKGVYKNGGMSIGISPALSLNEHINKYHSPSDVYDVIIYTGSGLMGREVTNIRSSDMVVIIGGQSGTLGEFAIAYDEGKLIGVIEGSGGITEKIPDIVDSMSKKTGSKIIYHSDPVILIEKMVTFYNESHYIRPSCFCEN